VERFVAGSASRDQGDFALLRRFAAVDDAIDMVDPQFGMRGLDSHEGIGQDVLGVVDEFFHG
jgi:hypothetical protein